MHICNLPFSKGIFSQQMKIAKVIPIFKSGDMFQFNNHRPISVFSQFKKNNNNFLLKDYNHTLANI